MASRKVRVMAITAKQEATYGVDPVPTGADDAMVMTNVEFTPLGGEEIENDEMLPYLGHQGVSLTGNFVEVAGDIKLAGSGAAGTPPAYGSLIRACRRAETIVAGTSVAYNPVSQAMESVTIYTVDDGVLHKLVGGHGNMVVNFSAKTKPFIRFTMRGLYVPVTTEANPTLDRSKFLPGLVSSKVNTPTLSLHGTPIVVQSVAIDAGNQIQKTDWVNDEEIDVDGGRMTGTIVAKATDLGVKNWFAAALAETTGALAITHGTVAGNIVAITAPKVQVGRPSRGNNNGTLTYSLPLYIRPDAGNDDCVLTFT